MENTPLVSIIIVNYNTFDLTKQCIKSIFDNTLNVAFEIVVVDNASLDGSYEKLVAEFPEISVLKNPKNSGFGAANNIGVQRCKGEFVLLLNSDTILHNNAVLILLNKFLELENSKKIGALGALLINEDGSIGRSSSEFPTFLNICLNTFYGVIVRLLKIRNSGFKQETGGFVEGIKQVDQLIGADMFMRKSVYSEFNGFDERFFMYFEETDLQKRMNELGLNSFLIDGPKITHLEGMSNRSWKKYKMYYKSLFLYLQKHKTIFSK
jgi:GT2 family glycosyltransferase